MDNQEPGIADEPAGAARRERLPRACVADARRSMRRFIAEALEELGLTAFECARVGDLDAMLASSRPDLVVVGSSAGGLEACEIMELLAARQFDGKVLVVGARISPMVAAIVGLGQKLGLAMLPLLPTPFADRDVRDRVASLLPGAAPPVPAPGACAPLGTALPALRYQPKIDARRVTPSGAEALAGSRRGARVRPTPGDFAAREDGRGLVAASARTIAQAMDDWHYFAARHGHVELSIDLPLAFFEHPHAIDAVRRQMPDHAAFEGLIIEIEAAEAIRNLGLAKSVARQLRPHSIAVSIDNLGTEWPALLGEHDLPFVELKADPQFVAGCARNPLHRATCRRIVDLADALGARAVAVGVESRADFLAVREMGFHLAQGPLFAEPMTAEEFARALPGRDVRVPR